MEATWKASVKQIAVKEECTKPGLPCTTHPHLAPCPAPGTKAPRAAACDAEDNVHRRFQGDFQSELGLSLLQPILSSLCKSIVQYQAFLSRTAEGRQLEYGECCHQVNVMI